MKIFLMNSLTICRRDFMAIVATPSFLLFLLAPLFFIGLGFFSSFGSTNLIEAERQKTSIAIILPAQDLAVVQRVDVMLRSTMSNDSQPARIDYRPATLAPADAAAYESLFNEKGAERQAMLYGSLSQPIILDRAERSRTSDYLRLLVRQSLLERDFRTSPLPEPVIKVVSFPSDAKGGASLNGARMIGMLTITAIFMLTLLIVSQASSGIAEEKANKVIEILAAAVPLESVFLGKILAMIGVGIIFVLFWGLLASFGGAAFAFSSGGMLSGGEAQVSQAMAHNIAPAVGWPLYALLAIIYTVCTFLIYGSLFLGLGGLASSPREVQMLSFPLVILQMMAFMLVASSVISGSDGPLRHVAEIFPFTTAYAMLGRAAVDANIWVHLIAIAWLAFWISIMINLSVRLFRRGVLGGGGSWKFWQRHAG